MNVWGIDLRFLWTELNCDVTQYKLPKITINQILFAEHQHWTASEPVAHGIPHKHNVLISALVEHGRGHRRLNDVMGINFLGQRTFTELTLRSVASRPLRQCHFFVLCVLLVAFLTLLQPTMTYCDSYFIVFFFFLALPFPSEFIISFTRTKEESLIYSLRCSSIPFYSTIHCRLSSYDVECLIKRRIDGKYKSIKFIFFSSMFADGFVFIAMTNGVIASQQLTFDLYAFTYLFQLVAFFLLNERDSHSVSSFLHYHNDSNSI